MRLRISSYIILDLEWVLNPTGVPLRGRDDEETLGRAAPGDRGRAWSDLSQAKECQELPGAPSARGKAGHTCSLRASGGGPPCPHLRLGLPASGPVL